MKKQTSSKRLDQVVVKAMASFAKTIAMDSAIEPRCWMIMHQPKEPKDLAKRLQAMK